MDWLTDNFIGDMYGPYFLLLYFVVIVATVGFSIFKSRQIMSGTPGQGGNRLIPTRPDPYEIAYLRGGVNEVVRLVVFELIQTRRLTMDPKSSKLVAADDEGSNTGAPELTPVKRSVLSFYATPQYAYKIFGSSALGEMAASCRTYEDDLLRHGLVVTDAMRGAAYRVRLNGIGVILLLGGYKLTAALVTGHANVGFLILFAILGVALEVTGTKLPRLTAEGQAYLRRLQTAFASLKRRRSNPIAVQPADSWFPGSSPAHAGDVDDIVLTVGVFGFSALAGTPQAAYAQIFGQAASTSGCGSTGSCGSTSGCGSSSGGGGDGGGGGGGCGGCGGCGGGGG